MGVSKNSGKPPQNGCFFLGEKPLLNMGWFGGPVFPLFLLVQHPGGPVKVTENKPFGRRDVSVGTAAVSDGRKLPGISWSCSSICWQVNARRLDSSLTHLNFSAMSCFNLFPADIQETSSTNEQEDHHHNCDNDPCRTTTTWWLIGPEFRNWRLYCIR